MLSSKMTFASLTRISDLAEKPFDIRPLDRSLWATGDYAVGEVKATSRATQIELTSGRMTEVEVGDPIVGALGVRQATLESVGSWQDVGDDLSMQAMTAAGLLGSITSRSTFVNKPIDLNYLGHAMRGEQKISMQDF